ncbi:MAG: hypothetical protein COB20_13925 [SAR86 cluster bacterium]|uniref:Uncharacterized protein n=1 Tax=SAR86 cluster bacterium TaxID=2030880 RepID=A0A2A4WXL7_9GAMM|nr:MAG: hypothetical protein COB20_13925 [SAR86 cluster bacterium]
MKFAYVSVFLLASLPAAAQDQAENNSNSGQESAQNTRPIEEITVTSDLSFSSLRFQIREARDKVYLMFNELNTDDDFDVDCRKTDYTGSYIQGHDCYPVFFDKAVAQNTQDAFGFSGPPAMDFFKSQRVIMMQERSNFARLRVKVLNIAIENNAFADTLLDLHDVEREYEYRKEQCMKKPAFLFLFKRC